MRKQLRSYYKTISTLFNRYMLWVPLAALLVLAGCFGWYEWNLRGIPRSHSQTFRITPGESAQQISAALKRDGLIHNAYAFEIYITLHGQRRRLQSGVYSVPGNASARQIAKMLATGRVDAKRLTIPEGATLAKVKELAAKQGIAPSDLDTELDAYRASGMSGLLASVPASVDLEGYFFPDTYTISGDTPARDLVVSMIGNLENNVNVYAAGFQSQGLTVHQGLTLASIVEKEVAGEADRAMVAGIFLNRLNIGMRLESDVTIHYGAALLGTGFSTALDSPYNTYRVDGLPIGPICNPGASALKAVANPAASDYLYFLSGRDGKTYFARTFAEHEQNIAKYLR